MAAMKLPMRHDLRDAYFVMESIVGRVGLLLGCLGQAGVFGSVLKPILPGGAAIVVALLIGFPCLMVFTITYCKQSILPPRAFRFCLIVAMCWFAVGTITAEVLCYLGYVPPDSPENAATLTRVLMHVGWLSFPGLIRWCVVAHRFELIFARRARRAVNPADLNPEAPSESI